MNSVSKPYSAQSSGFARILVSAMREDLALLLIIGVYYLAIRIMFFLYDLPFPPASNFLKSGIFYICSIIIIVGGGFILALLRDRPPSPFAFVAIFSERYRIRERLALALPALTGTALFLPIFSAAKSAIPYINEFSYDQTFINMDVAIHGDHAWKLIQPYIGYPIVTFLIAMCYHIWILLLYTGVPLVSGWIENKNLRQRFLLSYTLCWIIIGTLMATMLSSAGPCFVEYFHGYKTFKPLMDYLYEVDSVYHLNALEVQQALLRWREHDEYGLGRGITAMPSMHVSIAFLFALLGFKLSRGLGFCLAAFLLVIMIGSVHLGYHYAVDGYASIVLTAGIWIAVGAIGHLNGAASKAIEVGQAWSKNPKE